MRLALLLVVAVALGIATMMSTSVRAQQEADPTPMPVEPVPMPVPVPVPVPTTPAGNATGPGGVVVVPTPSDQPGDLTCRRQYVVLAWNANSGLAATGIDFELGAAKVKAMQACAPECEIALTAGGGGGPPCIGFVRTTTTGLMFTSSGMSHPDAYARAQASCANAVAAAAVPMTPQPLTPLRPAFQPTPWGPRPVPSALQPRVRAADTCVGWSRCNC